MKRYTIKSLGKMAREINPEYIWFDMLYYWMECGNMNMMDVFNHMSRKDTLYVIEHCFETFEVHDNTAFDIYKCAMTSLEKRL